MAAAPRRPDPAAGPCRLALRSGSAQSLCRIRQEIRLHDTQSRARRPLPALRTGGLSRRREICCMPLRDAANREECLMAEADDDAANARHRAKMVKRKAVQDREVAEKTIEKGLLIVHTGPGKGKSTAAFGLALRALGQGWRIGVVQFIKGAWSTGERTALTAFGDRVEWHSLGEGFTWETQDRARDIAAAGRAWEQARALMGRADIRLLILDELNIALRYDYLPLADVV